MMLKMKSDSVQSQGGKRLPEARVSGSGVVISIANLLACSQPLGLLTA